jgi:hypothetical protein
LRRRSLLPNGCQLDCLLGGCLLGCRRRAPGGRTVGGRRRTPGGRTVGCRCRMVVGCLLGGHPLSCRRLALLLRLLC